jgi:hypothetical protein
VVPCAPVVTAQPSADPRPVASRPRRPAAAVVASALFVVVATIVQLLRVEGVYPWRSVWAEDGVEFYGDALADPLAETILRAYAGYGHVVPRILATVGSWLPAEWFSVWAAVSSAAITSLLALFVYFATAPLLQAPLRRAVLAGSLLLLPVLPIEVVAAMCNIHWMLPIACLFAVAFPVDGRAAVAVRTVIVVLSPLTSPLCLLFVPIAAFQLVVFVRAGAPLRRYVVPIAYLAASAVQLGVYAVAEQRVAPAPPLRDALPDIVELYTLHVGVNGVLGPDTTTEIWADTSSWLGWAVTAVLVVLVALKLWRARGAARWWIASFAGASVGVFVFSMVQRAGYLDQMQSTPDVYNVFWSRYGIFPQLLLLVALLVPSSVERRLLTEPAPPATGPGPGAGPVERSTGGLPWVGIAIGVAVWVVVGLAPSYRQDVLRSDGPSWPDEIDVARERCELDPSQPEVVVETAPSSIWRLGLTCEQLDVGAP